MMMSTKLAHKSVPVLFLLTVLLACLPVPRRAEAAGLAVNTHLDANPPVTDGGCSLREAIANANANAAVFADCAAGTGGDTITFSHDMVITLVASLPDITDASGITVDGTGRTLIVRGGTGGQPAWKVTAGASLQLKGVILDQVSPPDGTTPQGIDNVGGTVAVNGSTIQRLSWPLVNRFGGTVVVADSFFNQNKGSGLANLGTAIVGRSLFLENLSDGGFTCFFCGGGGIHNAPAGVLTVGNSTFNGNRAIGGKTGGGIYNAGTATIVNATLVANDANVAGGGIHGAAGTTTLVNTILASNTSGVLTGAGPNDCSGTLTATGPNLISTLSGCTVTGIAPVVGPAVLGPLANNGGPTGTHALLNGSPAINAGDPAVCAAFPVDGKDQRGVARPQGPACDLGAYESDLAGTIGGRNLKITTGSIDLSWDGGTVQTGYTLLRVDTSTSAVTTTPLAAGATSYSDTTAVNGVTYCYVLLPTGPSGMLGLSDLLCGVTGWASGTPLPVGFTLALNQASTATMTLTSGGPEGTYLLMVPLDGNAPTTTAVTPGTFTKPVPPAGACFVVFADGFGGTFGFSNTLCGVPGVGNLRVSGMDTTLDELAVQLVAVATAFGTVEGVTAP